METVKFCPQCKSTDVMPYAGGTTGTWQCKKCKFMGSVFPEMMEENKETNLKKTKNQNG